MWPKKHIWEYKTSPKHPFDKTLWILLRPLMLWKAHGKISHWWHWQQVTNKDYQGYKVKGDPHAFRIRDQLRWSRNQGYIGLSHIKMSLGGWKTAYIVEPEQPGISWQYIAKGAANTGEVALKCAIILEGPIRALRGPDDWFIIGVDLKGSEIPLRISQPVDRHDKSYRHFPIV